MGGPLQFSVTSTGNGIPVWIKRLETVPGGFVIADDELTAGAKVLAGTPIFYNEQTRRANVVKTFKVYENASNSATAIKVYKGHHGKVGDYIGKTVGGAAYGITAIDDSNSAYDIITIGTTLGVILTADADVLFQSSASGASAADYKYTANALTYGDVLVSPGASLSAVTRGTVYAGIVPAVPATVKSALPHIIYSGTY